MTSLQLVSMACVLSFATTSLGCSEGVGDSMSSSVERGGAGSGAGAGANARAGSGGAMADDSEGSAGASGKAGMMADAGGDAEDAGGVGAAGTGSIAGMDAVGEGGAGGTGSAGGPGGAGGAGASAALPCAGDTPHGCYVAESGNHPMCPTNTPEQSAFYPPFEEWNGCNGIMPAAPFGGDPAASCSYRGPGGELATCLCDTGLHWLCTYPL